MTTPQEIALQDVRKEITFCRKVADWGMWMLVMTSTRWGCLYWVWWRTCHSLCVLLAIR